MVELCAALYEHDRTPAPATTHIGLRGRSAGVLEQHWREYLGAMA